jgi:hypothetical protein
VKDVFTELEFIIIVIQIFYFHIAYLEIGDKFIYFHSEEAQKLSIKMFPVRVRQGWIGVREAEDFGQKVSHRSHRFHRLSKGKGIMDSNRVFQDLWFHWTRDVSNPAMATGNL